jgi:hypothetical protein
VNVKSLLVSGPYAEPNMARWDQDLIRACAMYPNMRVFDWAAVVQRKWFINDGIHYTSLGYKYRAEAIAGALASAFPQGGTSNSCVVSSRIMAGAGGPHAMTVPSVPIGPPLPAGPIAPMGPDRPRGFS